MANNFLQFDPNATNMLNDADYTSNTQRQGGVTSGIASSTLHNKFFYQVSTMVAAWGQVISDYGQTASDTSLANLITAIKNTLLVLIPSQTSNSGKFLKTNGTATSWITIPFTKEYVSTGQAIAAAGLISLTHGLGAIPKLTAFTLKCISAELGYSVNDLAEINYAQYDGVTTVHTYGFTPVKTSTQILIRVGSDLGICVANKGNGDVSQIDVSKWQLIASAWA